MSSTPAPAPSATVTSPHDDLQWLVRLTIALVPLGTGWVLWSAPGAESDFNRRVTLAPFDLPLAVLTLVWMRTHVREGRVRRSRLAPTERRPSHDRLLVIIAIALAAAYAVALGAHPSLRGIDLTLRLAGSAAVIDVVRRAEGAQLRRLTVVTVIAAASQALLAIAQSINGRGFDLPPFDHAGPLFRFGDAYAGRGGLSHPYHLVVLLLLGLFAALIGGRHDTGHRLHRWCAASMVIGAGCAVTFSRAMLLAVIPAGLALLITEWRSARPRTLGSVLAGSPRTLGSVLAGSPRTLGSVLPGGKLPAELLLGGDHRGAALADRADHVVTCAPGSIGDRRAAGPRDGTHLPRGNAPHGLAHAALHVQRTREAGPVADGCPEGALGHHRLRSVRACAGWVE